MSEVNVQEANTQFSVLLQRVAAGEEITIERGGVPVARLVPVERQARRHFGADRGKFTVPDDFDRSLPEDVQTEFAR